LLSASSEERGPALLHSCTMGMSESDALARLP
jgi:hypothetical protein